MQLTFGQVFFLLFAIYNYLTPIYRLLGGGRLRQCSKTLIFNSGDPIFDLSEGEINSIKYHYILPQDIVRRSISKGFWKDDPMIKPLGFDLISPDRKEKGYKVSSPVTGSTFYEHLALARRAFNDPNHQVCVRISN